MYGGEILKPKSVYAILARGFPVWYFFKCCLEPVEVYVHLRAFFVNLRLCFHVAYPFVFFVIIFPFPYFAPKSFCLSRIVVGMASPILPLIGGRNFFRCFGTSCFVCIVWSCLGIIIIIIFILADCPTYLMVFHWNLSNSKFSWISQTLLSILAYLNNIIIWMVPICPPISNSSCLLNKLLGTVPL